MLMVVSSVKALRVSAIVLSTLLAEAAQAICFPAPRKLCRVQALQ